LLLAAPAGAVQFTPSATARLHTTGSTNPSAGTTWNTGANGATGGQISYSGGTLTVSGGIDVLNYYDPANAACLTDDDNCSFNFAPDLALSVEAMFDSVDVDPLGGTFYSITVLFKTNNPGPLDYDIVWDDAGTEVVRADWVAGTFQGIPTTGLAASLVYDSSSETVFGNLNVIAFFEVDATSTYLDLFDSGGNQFGIDLSAAANFNPSLNAVAKAAFDSGVLPDFTADGAGQIFRVVEGDFVIPEPATGLLFGLGLAGLAALSGRGRAR
jgi:hypothetical protein